MAEAARGQSEQVRPARRGPDRQGQHRDPVARRGDAQGSQGRRRPDCPDRDAPRRLRDRRWRSGGIRTSAGAGPARHSAAAGCGSTAETLSTRRIPGPAGRVSRKDVEDFIAQRQSSQQQAAARVVPAQPQAPSQTAPARQAPVPSLAGDELVPLSQMRRAIANNMVQAWSAPHAHAVMEVDMTDLMRYRDRVKHEFQEREGFDLSPAAFIAKAVVEALRTVPSVNSSWPAQGLIRHRELNLGYAVALGEDC